MASLSGITQQESGSYTDDWTGITLEICEQCEDLVFPDSLDDEDGHYIGICTTCRRNNKVNGHAS